MTGQLIDAVLGLIFAATAVYQAYRRDQLRQENKRLTAELRHALDDRQNACFSAYTNGVAMGLSTRKPCAHCQEAEHHTRELCFGSFHTEGVA